MPTRSIAHFWDQPKVTLASADTSEADLIQLRRAFYSGVISALSVMGESIKSRDPKVIERAIQSIGEQLQREAGRLVQPPH